jgi:hypothetical protein
MSFSPKGRKMPPRWSPVVAGLLIMGGMALMFLGALTFSYGQSGILVDHNYPYIVLNETTVAQEITDGLIELSLGALCFIVLAILFFTKRKFLFRAIWTYLTSEDSHASARKSKNCFKGRLIESRSDDPHFNW